MLKLSKEGIRQRDEWGKAGIRLPLHDVEAMVAHTKKCPRWVHVGPGNIFRGFVGELAQGLLNQGLVSSGITVLSTFDHQVVSRVYEPWDNLALRVVMHPGGDLESNVVASVGEVLRAHGEYPLEWKRAKEVFSASELQMVSFTITEKGYHIQDMEGNYLPEVLQDYNADPHQGIPQHGMALVAALLFERFRKGAYPVAMVSMDNFSHNGERLFESIRSFAEAWVQRGLVEEDFLTYVEDPSKVSFPWSMIDKITPRPDKAVAEKLHESGFVDTEMVVTDKHTYIAPFVNTEGPEYLVVEENFPNGRPPLEKVGVYLTDRQTVNLVERMKVCTCLNPLHTALAVFGCLLGYETIAAEMEDPALVRLVQEIGYKEGLPVVADPGIFVPENFLKEVLEERFPNPYIPDTPQRIATDTSQKLPIRYGETLKEYAFRDNLDITDLKAIPLTLAGWCRYLLGLDDQGKPMPLSPDPLLPELQTYFQGFRWGDLPSKDLLRPILSNPRLFGSNLYELGIACTVEDYFLRMVQGSGAVRLTLEEVLDKGETEQ